MADSPLAHGEMPPYTRSGDGQSILRELTAGLPLLDQTTVAALAELDACEAVVLEAHEQAISRQARRAALDAAARQARGGSAFGGAR